MPRLFGASAVVVGACALSTAVHAQSTAPSEPSNSASSATAVGEVMVTAQRRTERLQDVPVAVAVVSAQQLNASNYVGLTDLQLLVPSLQYNAYVGGGFQVRGVGTQSINLSTEQDVGIVIDDVVQGLPELTFAIPSYQALTDIDRVEVLKGPQGTLFGKNSSVGVLQIVTKMPKLDAFSVDGSVSAASHGQYNVQVNANIPIGDTIAARISGFEYHDDGFIKNVYNGQELGGYDQYGVRGKLLWKPTPDLSVYLIGEHLETSAPGNGAWTLRSCGSGFAAFSPCATDAAYGIVPGPTNRQVALDAPTPATTRTTSGSLHIEYNFGSNTLTSVTAYSHVDSNENVDVDNTPLRILDVDSTQLRGDEFTQEIRLSSPENQFISYTVGAFYYNVKSTLYNVLAGTYGFEPENSTTLLTNGFAGLVTGGQTILDARTQSYAAFAQFTLHATQRLQLIGGLRFTNDHVITGVHVAPYPNICQFDYAFGAPCEAVPLPSPVVSESANASNVSGKVTVKYNFTDEVNAYATFATGYKGPAISYGALLPLSPVQPETSTDYEVGFKSQLFDRRLVLNADAFFEQYKNFQADTFVLNAADPGASNFELANAGGLQSKGVEADATWSATHELTFTGSLAYAPTKFTNYVIQCENQYTNPATPGACYSVDGNSLFNAKGYPLPQAPEFTYVVSANYQREVINGYQLDATANWSWRSSAYTIVADPQTIQSGYGLLGANIGFGPQDGRWRLSLFGRNLLNQQFVSAIFQTYLDNGAATGIAKPTIGYSNVPNIQSLRTVGVKFDFKIGG